MGVSLFVAELVGLGHNDAHELGPGRVAWIWQIPVGPLIDWRIELGVVVADDYPDAPPRGPFVRPHLLPLNPQGGSHPFDGVHNGSSQGFPDDSWQYWSRPYNGWAASTRDARAYLAFLRTLFDQLPNDLVFPAAA